MDFGDDGVAGAAFDAEHVPLARLADASVDYDGQGNRLGRDQGVIWLLFGAFRQGVHRKRQVVDDPVLPAQGQRVDARLAVGPR